MLRLYGHFQRQAAAILLAVSLPVGLAGVVAWIAGWAR